MASIVLTTVIRAPLDRVFDLARSIDLHRCSASKSREQAIAGVTTGLIGPGEEVTWRARHFLVWHRLTVRICEYTRPFYFRDQQVKGRFASMKHDHFFVKTPDGSTEMKDVFTYTAPLGILGEVADKLVLQEHFRKFLVKRNRVIKRVAESDEWQKYL